MNTTNIECLKNFTDHRFAQLAVYDNGRTPLYLTEEQYNAIRDLVAKASSKPELFAVHAQGPDEIYPAYDQAEAERHAAELNALRTPPGISVSAVVIPSPFTELEHWKCFAEQEHEHKLHLLAGVAPTDANLSAMRREGLSIDGDNAYKRDLIDVIVGALAFGKQGVNPPPVGHWGQQFWDIGRAEGEEKERLINQRDAILLQARVWAGEAKTQQAITREVGEILGGVPNWGPIAAGVEALRQQLAERDALLRRVIDTGELSRKQHSELEADICEVLRPHAQPTDGVKSDE